MKKFLCCGGSDENPQSCCQDCPEFKKIKMNKNKEIMLEVFKVFDSDDMYRISMHKELSMYGIFGTGYDIKISLDNIIIRKNNVLKNLQYFVKAELCTLTKFKKIMQECGLYDNGKQINVPFLMETGKVGVIVRYEEDIPLYFCVHRDLIREYKKDLNKKEFLKFAA
jgi:hypothetical protein